MPGRDDVIVEWKDRVIIVESPSTDITIPDLVTTGRNLEAGPENSEDDELFADVSGAADLQGGLKVSVTAQLKAGTLLAFDQRPASVASGTATTADASGLLLTDASATFVSSGVKQGALVLNVTDGASVGTVLKVVDETHLRLMTRLFDGTNNDFEVGDSYKVWNVEQCSVSGGNLAIEGGGSPIMPTAFTQVVRASAADGTVFELEAIQYSSFSGGVTVDPVNGIPRSAESATNPAGTPRNPVDNFADALDILNERGLENIYPIGSVTLSGLDFTDVRFVGRSPTATSMTVDLSANVTGAEFAFLTLDGTFDGLVFIENCTLGDVTMVEGTIERCGLQGKITLSGSVLIMYDCSDAIAGSGIPEVSMGSTTALVMRGYRGAVLLSDKTGSADVSIDGDVRVVLDTTFGGTGEVLVKGSGPPVENNSLLGFTNVNEEGLVSNTASIKRAIETFWVLSQ